MYCVILHVSEYPDFPLCSSSLKELIEEAQKVFSLWITTGQQLKGVLSMCVTCVLAIASVMADSLRSHGL